MTKDEFIAEVGKELGGTQLNLSAKTLDTFYTNVFFSIKEDAEVSEEFIRQQALMLKTLDGQLHADIAKEMQLNKSKWEEEYKQRIKTNEPKVETIEKKTEEEVPQYVKDIIDKMNKLEEQLSSNQQREREKVLRDKITKSFNAKFAKAGIEVNKFFYNLVLPSVDLTKDITDIDVVVKDLETAYYTKLKEANIPINAKPFNGNGNSGKGSNIVDDYFKRKAEREKRRK